MPHARRSHVLRRLAAAVRAGRLAFALALALACAALPRSADAQNTQTPKPSLTASSCTHHEVFKTNLEGRFDQLFGNLVKAFEQNLDGLSQSAYTALISDSRVTFALYAAMALTIAFFGTAFLFGFIPQTFGQAFIRLMKILVILALMTPNWGWELFNSTIGALFNGGVDELILAFSDSQLSGGYQTVLFARLEEAIQILISPVFAVLLFTSSGFGPYGWAVALACLFSIVLLVLTALKVLFTYAMFLFFKALLLAFGPIFFGFLLFDRTKQYFIAWLNQLVNVSLQVILMFMFVPFMAGMLVIAAQDLFDNADLKDPQGSSTTASCEAKMERLLPGSQDVQFWRFLVGGQPYEAQVGGAAVPLAKPDPSTGETHAPFPLDIFKAIILALLAFITYRGTEMASQVASGIAGSALRLDQIPGATGDWMRSVTGMGSHGKGKGYLTEDEILKRTSVGSATH